MNCKIRELCFLFVFAAIIQVFSNFSTAQEKSPLWMEVKGQGKVTVIFICGNGADSSVWKKVADDVRKLGVRAVRYDRSGLGKSRLWEGEYKIENEVTELKKSLKIHKVSGPFILVPHSYGGLIATLFAHKNSEVKGVVFVDAVLPDELRPQAVKEILEMYRPRYDMVREKAPKLAKVVIPVVEGYPATAKTTQKYSFAKSVPFMDIRAETSAATSKEEEQFQEKVHKDFVKQSKNRTFVLAKGSGHQVMKDRPDLILESIKGVLEKLDTDGSQSN